MAKLPHPASRSAAELIPSGWYNPDRFTQLLTELTHLAGIKSTHQAGYPVDKSVDNLWING